MRRNCWSASLLGAIVFCACTAFGQQALEKPDPHNFQPRYTVRRWKEAGQYQRAVRFQSQSGQTIAFWSYSLVSQVDNQPYSGMIVGRAPYFHGHRATVIPTVMVPVIFTFQDTGTTFDPTTNDPCLGQSVVSVMSNSPMFNSVDWVMNGVDIGSTQYIDAFQRAEFWQFVAGTPYHTLMGLSMAPAVQVTVPIQDGQTYFGGQCPIGLLDIDWWDSYVQNTLIPSLAGEVGPTKFPIFQSDSVVEYQNGDPNQCCVLGFHNSFLSNGVLQTYSVATLDTSGMFGNDITVMSHEVGEWMNDPTTGNPTPAWGHVGQVSGCANNFEVGDPLSLGGQSPTNEWVVPLNGFTYHLQELAFFSWFYRDASFGAGGIYSDNGTFTQDAGPLCQ